MSVFAARSVQRNKDEIWFDLADGVEEALVVFERLRVVPENELSARTTSPPVRIEISRSALLPPITTATRSLPPALRCIDKNSNQVHFEL